MLSRVPAYACRPRPRSGRGSPRMSKRSARSRRLETDESRAESLEVPGPVRRPPHRRSGQEEALCSGRRATSAAQVAHSHHHSAACGGARGGRLCRYNSTVYYLAYDNGQVALYRGLPWEFLGVEFSSVYRLATVEYQSLSPYDRTRVDSHELVSKREGEQFLDGLSTEL